MQEEEFTEPSSKSNAWCVWWSAPSVYASASLILTRLFDWSGGEPLDPFVFAAVEAAVYFVFIGVFIGALVKAFAGKSEKGVLRLRFVALDSLASLVVIFFPFSQVMKICDFNMNLGRRMEVVKMVSEGKIIESQVDGRTAYLLPDGWRDLSKGGGEVMVIDVYRWHNQIEEHIFHVLFFVYRGLLGHYSGFEYCSDGKPGNVTDKAKSIEALRQNWYWVAY